MKKTVRNQDGRESYFYESKYFLKVIIMCNYSMFKML